MSVGEDWSEEDRKAWAYRIWAGEEFNGNGEPEVRKLIEALNK